MGIPTAIRPHGPKFIALLFGFLIGPGAVFAEASRLGATVVRGPYLQTGTPGGMTVRWRTDAQTDTRLWYGPSPGNLTQIVDLPTLGLNHVVTLTGLLPATDYYYAIGTSATQFAGDDADHHFQTSPLPGTTPSVRIWVTGDSGVPGLDQDNVRDAYLAYPGAEDTDLWMMLGDNAYVGGTAAEYDAAVFDVYPSLLRTAPLWPTRGNHDIVRVGGNNDYYNFFSLPAAGQAGGVPSGTEAYHSFDYANIHFVCLDSEGSDRSPTGPMLTWLQLDLVAATAEWTIVYWHHPPYTDGSHDSDDPSDSGGRMRDMRENALPILDANDVDLVLVGHNHAYERSFLLDGHYDISTTLDASMVIDGGNGQLGGDGAYEKPADPPGGNHGAVYVAVGNGSSATGGPLDHPAMASSLNIIGSLVIDVQGSTLHATMIDDAGTTQDSFTISKVTTVSSPAPQRELELRMTTGPNPFSSTATIRFDLPNSGETRVRVIDTLGREIRRLATSSSPAGQHQLSWDGRDSAGRMVGAGVYFVILEHSGNVETAKVVRMR